MKMNINFTKVLFLILFCGLFTQISCTKSNSILSQPNSEISSIKTVTPNLLPGPCPYDCHDTRCKGYFNGYCGTDTIAITKNSNNLYDYEGSYHNKGVASILPTVNFSSSNLDSVVLQKVKTFVVTLGYNSDSAQQFYNIATAQGLFPYSHIQELDSLGNTLQLKGKLSSYGNTYVQQIYSNLLNNLNTDSMNASNYNAFANSMLSTETSIKNDSRLSAYEKQVLLSAASIGRYSASYWANYLNNAALSQALAVHPFLLQKLKRWIRVVMCDIGGGVIGIVAGPVGIVTGAVGSSIIADASL